MLLRNYGMSIMFERHQVDVEKIRKAFLELKTHKSCSLMSSFHPSNVTRAPEYKSRAAKVDINSLNRILLIDPIERIVVAELRVTMEELAQATLEYGMMVPVLPEFKGITVGGAIMGLGTLVALTPTRRRRRIITGAPVATDERRALAEVAT